MHQWVISSQILKWGAVKATFVLMPLSKLNMSGPWSDSHFLVWLFVNFTLHGSVVHHRENTERQTTTLSHIQPYGELSCPYTQICLPVFANHILTHLKMKYWYIVNNGYIVILLLMLCWEVILVPRSSSRVEHHTFLTDLRCRGKKSSLAAEAQAIQVIQSNPAGESPPPCRWIN